MFGSTPIAEYEVYLQPGAKPSIFEQLRPAAGAESLARGQDVTEQILLNDIARAMKGFRNYGADGPRHEQVPDEARPQAYRETYDSEHIEFYFGVWVRYGIQAGLSRLVIISMRYPPAVAPRA